MMRTKIWARRLFVLVLLAGAGLWAADYIRHHPEDMPWTALDLRDPVGVFTGQKLAALTGDGALCRTLLEDADIAYRALPAREAGDRCGYRDGVSLIVGRGIAHRPGEAALSCPVAAALAVWEREGIQPAAMRHFGQPVVAIDHLGTFACRRVNGSETGRWSEHATADAIDIAAFELADGSRISIVEDWAGPEPERAFLVEIRDRACGLFATVLSPDYNRAHADHFHLDQAARGRLGRSLCR
ncbi:extensin family protein [Parasphingopyxis algicola]|uniref:extensin-like domain-containing protein n=1 Tax=Parasphingopyxis algicola TaxID=2026624 RepID=UPI0015A0D044|nr:extensin family protein [Parasphingopyxis algicola]QLC25901.1 extensin family protein [Parasphingopyxis algicola]